MCTPDPMKPDLVITHALIVTADAAGTVVRDGAVEVRDGRIVRIGPAADVGLEAAEVVDAGGMLLMPGLINTHCHAGDSLFRGLVEDLPLEPWLQTVWKAEGAILNRDTVRLGATLGFAELLLGGVTTVMDMFWHPRETVAAARAVGLRVATGGIFFDGPGGDGARPADRLADAAAFFDEFDGDEDVLAGCYPHGAYTVGPEALAGGEAAGGGAGRALLDPLRGDARRAGRHRGALWAAGSQAPRPSRAPRRADGAGALRLARRRGDRRSWRGPGPRWRITRCRT